jgi:ribosome-associated protein
MTRPRREDDASEEVKIVIKGIQEVKGKDIVHLDLTNIPNAVCDHFLICHGESDTQVAAIATSVQKMMRESVGEKPWHVEGTQNAEWILVDYVDIVVHIFHKEKREFYDLEGLWADARVNSIENVA